MHFIRNFAHCVDFSCFVKCRLILIIFHRQWHRSTRSSFDTNSKHHDGFKLESTSQPSQTPASLIMEHTDEPSNSVSKIDPDLSQLSGVISPTTLPNPEQSTQFLMELTS